MDEYIDSTEQPLFVPHVMEERNTNTADTEMIRNLSQKYMNYHVIAQMADGSRMEGIIEDVNDQGVVMLIPEDVDADEDERFFAGPGPRRRFRRFRRFRFPFIFFAAPFLFPFPH